MDEHVSWDPWPDRSLLLRLSVRGSVVVAEVEASDGPTLSGEIASLAVIEELLAIAREGYSQVIPGLTSILIRTPVGVMLAGAVQSLPQYRSGPHVKHPLAIPILVDPDPGLWPLPWEAAAPEGRGEYVRCARTSTRPVRGASLPLRLVVDRDSLIAPILTNLLGRFEWLDADVVQNVLTTEETSGDAIQARANGAAIVMMDLDAFRNVNPGVFRRDTSPRLWLLATQEPWRALRWLAPPDSGAILIMSVDQAPIGLEELLLGIVHDHPLHEVVQAARRSASTGDAARSPVLLSSLDGLHGLRFTASLMRMRRDARMIELSLPDDSADSILSADSIRGVPEFTRMLDTVRADVRNIEVTAIDFGRETSGMPPLIGSKRSLDAARANAAIVRLMGAAIKRRWRDQQVAVPADRVVNVVLLRTSAGPAVSEWAQPQPTVGSTDTLAAGRTYELLVGIGARWPETLVDEGQPPVGPLLGDADEGGGHDLDVVVFGLDFTSTPPLKRIRLPRDGASEIAEFEVTAPERLGPARLRVCVYKANYLIQSYRLDAHVTAQEGSAGDGVRVVLECSASRGLTNLDDLRPRFVQIGLNQNGDAATHTLTLKRDDVTAAVHLTEAAMAATLGPVRSLLEEAAWDDGKKGPRFPASRPVLEPNDEFDRYISRLASAGSDLYVGLWQRMPRDMQDGLRDLTKTSDDTIQITRYDPNYVLPWSAMYDFALEPGVPVCHGFTRVSGKEPISCANCLDTCLYPDKSKAVCVFGFWGTRHQVEQPLQAPQKHEDAITSLGPIRDGAVLVSNGLPDGPGDNLVSNLSATVGASLVREVMSATELLTVLWENARRPAILLLFGHHDKGTMSMPGAGSLQARQITRQVIDRRQWDAPHPVVLLAACDSAARDLGTMSDFLGAFADAGAAAVVGTEVVVFESLAVRFGEDIATALLHGKPVSFGAAIVALRRALLRQGDPLGFVFTPYGSADLTRAN